MQFAILAQSPREMALTDRILPRYFLSRVRVSIRPRFFYTPKNPRPNQPASRSHASAPPTVRTAQFETQIIPSRQVATYVRGGRLWMILLAPMPNPLSLRKSYPRCNDPAKRGSVCEAFEKKPLPQGAVAGIRRKGLSDGLTLTRWRNAIFRVAGATN